MVVTDLELLVMTIPFVIFCAALFWVIVDDDWREK